MLSHLCIAITRNLVEIKHSISHVCSIKVVQKSQSKRFATELLYKIILFLEYDQSDAPQRQTHKFVLLGGGGGPIFDSENAIETLFVANYFIPNTVVPPAPPSLQ